MEECCTVRWRDFPLRQRRASHALAVSKVMIYCLAPLHSAHVYIYNLIISRDDRTHARDDDDADDEQRTNANVSVGS